MLPGRVCLLIRRPPASRWGHHTTFYHNSLFRRLVPALRDQQGKAPAQQSVSICPVDGEDGLSPRSQFGDVISRNILFLLPQTGMRMPSVRMQTHRSSLRFPRDHSACSLAFPHQTAGISADKLLGRSTLNITVRDGLDPRVGAFCEVVQQDHAQESAQGTTEASQSGAGNEADRREQLSPGR